MRLDIKKLHKNYLVKKTKNEGHTTDIIITLMQSCELVVGNYLFVVPDKIKAKRKIKDAIIEFLLQFTDSHIIQISEQYLEFSNGSKIYFGYVEGIEFNNFYWDFFEMDYKDLTYVKSQITKYFDSIEHTNKEHQKIIWKIDRNYGEYVHRNILEKYTK